MPLDRRHWIFDMDGTLTVAAHDFDGFKEEHNLDPLRPILEQLAGFSEARRLRIQRALVEWETQIADRAKPAPDVLPLLQHLKSNDYRLAILTRNTRELALRTLERAGLAPFFDDANILGRHCAEPKPSPAGPRQILGRWRAAPSDAVMVGDYLFDLQSGRAAGMFCIYVDRKSSRMWQDQADLTVARLDRLLDPAI